MNMKCKTRRKLPTKNTGLLVGRRTREGEGLCELGWARAKLV